MNHGLIIKPRESDYVFGVNSPLSPPNPPASGDWTPYFHFNENQRNPQFDDDGCACYASNKILDAWMDYLMPILPPSLVEALAPFMDSNSIDGTPHFHSSPRFTECMTGNGMNGNSLPECFDAIRMKGAVPWTALPFDATMTAAEYFSPIPQSILDQGLWFLAQVGGANFLQYHWRLQNGVKNPTDMAAWLRESPLAIGVAVDEAGWNQVVPTDVAASDPVVHALAVMKEIVPVSYVSDNYAPYEKQLDANYPIPYIIQAFVTITPPPPAPPAPPSVTDANPSNAAVSTWLQSLVTWLGAILKTLQK